MDEPGFILGKLANRRVAIWGLGLMGGSLAMALHGKCAWIGAIDRDPAVTAQGLALGIVDAASTRPEDILERADVIVLAMPVRTILWALDQLQHVCGGPAMVMDLGSTKGAVIDAMERLPERFDPVGAHPMCGKERGSLASAIGTLYHAAPFALIRLKRSSAAGCEMAETMALAAGARPQWLNAVEHDRWVAATSHVPFLLSSALAHATPAEASPMVGPGFRSTARLATSSPEMMIDILATNRKNVQAALRELRETLETYDRLLEQENYDSLAALFLEAAAQMKELGGDRGAL